MGNYFMTIKFLTLKSLLISILLHITILNLFVLSFPTLEATHKPKFIFWGSILKSQDIIIRKDRKDSSSIDFNSKAYPNEALKIKEKLSKNVSYKKPVFVTPKEHQKVVLKSNFLPEDVEKEKNEGNLEKIGLDIKIVPYKPLRLKSK